MTVQHLSKVSTTAHRAICGEGDDTQADHRSMGILGASPVGLTAVLLAARANLDPLVLQGTGLGGQRVTTTSALDSVTTAQTVVAYCEGVRV